MATEDELLARIRRLYGIDAPDPGAAAGVGALQQRLAQLQAPPKPPSRSRNDYTTRPVVTPPDHSAEIAAIQQQIADANAGHAGGFSAEARANHGMLESVFGQQRQAATEGGMQELHTRFRDSLLSLRRQLAANGLAGGGAAASSNRRVLGSLFTGRQRLTTAVNGADAGARRAVDNGRLELERQVKLGTAPDPSQINALSTQADAVNDAYHNITQDALGGLLVNAGSTYRAIDNADASGRAGWSSFAPLTSRRPASVRGSIT